LIKLLPYILFEKYINILALEMASPGNRHCASCIDALSFPIVVASASVAKDLGVLSKIHSTCVCVTCRETAILSASLAGAMCT